MCVGGGGGGGSGINYSYVSVAYGGHVTGFINGHCF